MDIYLEITIECPYLCNHNNKPFKNLIMLVSKELNLVSFEFWSGAKDHSFTRNELQEIQNQLEDLYPDGLTETQVNDIFWFEEEFLCSIMGIDYDEYLER